MEIDMVPEVPKPAPVLRSRLPEPSEGRRAAAVTSAVDKLIPPLMPLSAAPVVKEIAPPVVAWSRKDVEPAVKVILAPSPLELAPTAIVIPEATWPEDEPVVMAIPPPVALPTPVAIEMLPVASVVKSLSGSLTLAAVDKVRPPVTPQRLEPVVIEIAPPSKALSEVLDPPAVREIGAPAPLPLAPTARVIPEAAPAAEPVVMSIAPPTPNPLPVAIVMLPELSVPISLLGSFTLDAVDNVKAPVTPQRLEPVVMAIAPPLVAPAVVLEPPALKLIAAPVPLPLAPTAREIPWAMPLEAAPVEIAMPPPVA